MSLLALFLSLFSIQGIPLPGGGMMHAQTPACATSADSQAPTNTGGGANGYSASYVYTGFAFVAASSYTMCKIELSVIKIGTPSYTVTVSIYTDSADHPGTLVGTGSAAVNVSTFGTSYGNITFTGMSASITSGTRYWYVMQATSAPPNDMTNYSRIGYGVGTQYQASADSAVTWTTYFGSYQGIFTSYK